LSLIGCRIGKPLKERAQIVVQDKRALAMLSDAQYSGLDQPINVGTSDA
jgi:hypothetical protein